MDVLYAMSLQIMVLSIGIVSLRQYMQGGSCKSKDRVDGKVVIVTGANSGLGRETATELIRRGATVYLACRSIERGLQAADEIMATTGADMSKVIVMRLDLSSFTSIRQFVEEFRERENKLDILMNNAGLAYIPHRTLSDDGYEMTFAVNYLGHFLLTHLLMDRLIASDHARIINISSKLHSAAKNMSWNDLMFENNYSIFSLNKIYGQSKLAMIFFTMELAKQLQGTSVKTYAVHPGLTSTEIGKDVIANKYVRTVIITLAWPFFKTISNGIQTQLCCAVDENLSQSSGKYYSDCYETKPDVGSTPEADSKRLWDTSLQLVHLTDSELHPVFRHFQLI